MSLLDSVKSILTGGRVDVRGRYSFETEAISGTMSSFYMARDRRTGEIVGLKILDREKTAAFEARFKGLKKPSEGEIAQVALAPQHRPPSAVRHDDRGRAVSGHGVHRGPSR